MKKILSLIVFLLIPFSIWAMTPVTDSDLSDITGQAGVNINADLTMDLNIGTLAWGDANGITGVYNPWTTVAQGGYCGMTGFNISNLVIRARTDSTDNYNTYSTLMLKPITIDVGTGNKTAQGGTANTTFVRFGLGALKISTDQIQFNCALGQRPSAGSDPVLNQIKGIVTIGPLAIYVNPTSYIDIFSHGAMGISFDVNLTLDRVTIGYLSWGDADGLGTGVSTYAGQTGKTWMSGTTAGYVGLNNINLGDAFHPAVIAKGTVAIDVATTSNGLYTYLNALWNGLNGCAPIINFHNQAQMVALYKELAESGIDVNDLTQVRAYLLGRYFGTGINPQFVTAPLTVVHISFPEALPSTYNLADGSTCGFRLEIAKIAGDVALGDTANFAATGPREPGILGDIYLQQLSFNIKRNSWIDIWAH
jgi:hypothetical protein